MRFCSELLTVRVSAYEFGGGGCIQPLSQTKGEVQIGVRLHLVQTSWEQGCLVGIMWISLPSVITCFLLARGIASSSQAQDRVSSWIWFGASDNVSTVALKATSGFKGLGLGFKGQQSVSSEWNGGCLGVAWSQLQLAFPNCGFLI